MAPEDDAPDLALAKRRGKRIALAAFVAFAAAYILLSTWEVVAGVFGLDAPGKIAAHGTPDPACVQALRASASASASTSDDTEERSADSACRAPGGATGANLDALAALHRFQRARAASRQAEAIAPLRRDLEEYLEP